MLDRFFSPTATKASSKALGASNVALLLASLHSSAITAKTLSVQPSYSPGDYSAITTRIVAGLLTPSSSPQSPQPQEMKYESSAPKIAASDLVVRVFEMIAEELGVDVRMLTRTLPISDWTHLCLHVLSQKLREELKIEIRDTVFLEVSTFGDLRTLLR